MYMVIIQKSKYAMFERCRSDKWLPAVNMQSDRVTGGCLHRNGWDSSIICKMHLLATHHVAPALSRL